MLLSLPLSLPSPSPLPLLSLPSPSPLPLLSLSSPSPLPLLSLSFPSPLSPYSHSLPTPSPLPLPLPQLVLISFQDVDDATMSKVTTLYVSQIASSVTDEQLKEAFSPHGTVTKCHISRFPDSTESRGFGFVDFTVCFTSSTALFPPLFLPPPSPLPSPLSPKSHPLICSRTDARSMRGGDRSHQRPRTSGIPPLRCVR